MIRLLFMLVMLAPGLAGCQHAEPPLRFVMEMPGGGGGRKPALFMLHGYGSNEHDLHALAKTIAPGFAVFSLRAPLSTPHGGYCWFPLEFMPGQKLSYDYEIAVRSRKLVLDFIRYACMVHRLDSTQICLLGFSQGAILSYDIALAAPGLIRGVLALSGGMMEETRGMKLAPAVKRLNFFIAHGRGDDILPFADSERAVGYLENAGIKNIEFRAYEAPHTITAQEISDITAWLAVARKEMKAGQ